MAYNKMSKAEALALLGGGPDGPTQAALDFAAVGDQAFTSRIPHGPTKGTSTDFTLPANYWEKDAETGLSLLETLQADETSQFHAAPTVAPAPAPAAAPAGGGGGGGAPAGGGPGVAPSTQQTAYDAIANVQTTLNKQNKAIQQAVQSGLIDIGAAGTMWDNQRKQIYADFIRDQGGAAGQYGSEEERLKDERDRERKRVLADLNARGVDASMVGDELGILDALVASRADANAGYMADTRNIAAMANVDRKWLGEGIFGGYKQDLRSGARDLMLEAGLDAATAEGQRLDQALASNALADRFEETPATLMAGMIGGVDIPGMSFTTSEREGSEKFLSGESALDRLAAGIDPDTGLPYGFDTDTGLTALQDATFTAQGIDPETGRPYGFDIETGLTAGEQESGRRFGLELLARGIDPVTNMPYGFDPMTGLTAADTIAQQNFMLGLTGQGIDTRETITQGTPWGPIQVANPNYGRPIGFDEQTGLTAGQTQDQKNWDALFEQGDQQWTDTFNQNADQFTAGQTAAGIDTRKTIFQPDPQTGYMRSVQNPNYGRPYGFDAATGLTAGETADQTYRDALLAADETAAATQEEQWQSTFDAGMMGVDRRQWIPDESGQTFNGIPAMTRNPMYGMTPAQQADYTMDLWTMTQAEGPQTTVTQRLMSHLSQLSTIDPNFTSAALTDINEVIQNSPALISKGLSDTNVLFALGKLANTVGEDGESYPYRDLLNAVQQEMTRQDDDGAPTYTPPGEDMTAVADAAAAATATGNTGPSFIPGGGEFGIDTTVAPVPAGQQPGNASQDQWRYEEGSPIEFYLNDGRPVYTDVDGEYYVMQRGSEKYVAEGDKSWEFSYRSVPERIYRGDEGRMFGVSWPADQEWPSPLPQG